MKWTIDYQATIVVIIIKNMPGTGYFGVQKKLLRSTALYCACTFSSPQVAHLTNSQFLQRLALPRNSFFGFQFLQHTQNVVPLQALHTGVLFRLRFFTADES